MAKIIVLGAMKGGVGKSVSTYNLAYSLNKLGKKVLVVDFDSSANITRCVVEDIKTVEISIGDLMMNQMDEEEQPNPAEVLKTSVDGCLYKEQERRSKGMMVAQHIGWKPLAGSMQCDLYGAWFHTDDYGSRISSYEKNILYAFYMPSFYGEGVRLACTFRWDWMRRLSLSVKVAHTRYFDRDRIGTTTEEINGANKTDLYALVRWKF